MEGHTKAVNKLALLFTANCSYLVSASDDGTINIWNLSNPEEDMMTLQDPNSKNKSVMAIAVIKSGKKIISGGMDCQVRLWDVSTGANEKMNPAHTKTVHDVVVFSNDTLFATASWDSTIVLWEVKTKMAYKTIHTPGYVNTLSVYLGLGDDDLSFLIAGGSNEFLNVYNYFCQKVEKAPTLNNRQDLKKMTIKEL